MRALHGYIRKNLSGQNYILPVGQKIAQHSSCFKINASGAMIWDYIFDADRTFDEVFRHMRNFVPENEVSDSQLKDDILCFINILKTQGMIDMADGVEVSSTPDRIFCIAGINIYYYGKSDWIHNNLLDFCAATNSLSCDSVGQSWKVENLKRLEPYQGKMILTSKQMDIYESDSGYFLRFTRCEHLVVCFISFDGKNAVFYYDNSDTDEGVEELFCGFRVAYFYFAMLNGRFALHSSSLLYRDKVWLFSASAGTGKSTHTELWQKIADVSPINGDLNLLGLSDEKVIVYGIPWCGTSGIYCTGIYEAGGVILLKRSDADSVCSLSKDEKQLLLAQRFVSPLWNEDMVEHGLQFAKKVSEKILICRLCCTKNVSAAVAMKDYIDEYESDI